MSLVRLQRIHACRDYKDSIYVVPTQKLKDPDQDEHWSNGSFAADVTLKAEQHTAN